MNEITYISIFYNNIVELLDKNSDLENKKFLNFTELIFTQNQILYKFLDNILNNLSNYLASFDESEFINSFKLNVPHYKINQNMRENNVTFYPFKEDILFSDFLLLMTSRFGILTNDINTIMNPIYILNKTGDDIFNNVYAQEKLSSYQENIYLMILDYKTFSLYLDNVHDEIGKLAFYRKAKIKKIIFVFINLNLFMYILIVIILFGYISLYLIVVFKILDDVYIDLRKKIGEVTVNKL